MKKTRSEVSPALPFEELLSLEQMEKRYLAWAAKHFHGDRKALAEKLGTSERTLYRKLKEADSSRLKHRNRV